MTQTLRQKWLSMVREKNSVLCAGFDPADFEMNRGNIGLPGGVEKEEWATNYLLAVAPYCTAVKFNTKFWGRDFDLNSLGNLTKLAKVHGLLVIDDSKLADTTDSNEAAIFYSRQRGSDAITLAPYTGNMAKTAELCMKRELGAITMCLMSNTEFQDEKTMLVRARDNLYEVGNLVRINGKTYVPRYINSAHDAFRYGLDGIVIGAPGRENHITARELENVSKYVLDGKMVVLSPGIGYQQGYPEELFKNFGRKNVIASAGRSLMFPNGSHSTPKEQAEAAKHYKEYLNKIRAA